MKWIPHLAFKGRCREAFEQYARILGGTIVINAFAGAGDADMPEGCKPPPRGQNRFAELGVGAGHSWATTCPPNCTRHCRASVSRCTRGASPKRAASSAL
jgi:hypothetical protein